MQRFRIGRAVFIAITSIIVGIFGGPRSGIGIVGLIPVVAVIMASFYATAKMFWGVGGFTEDVPPGESVPDFDWRRFLLELLYFIGIFLAFFIIVGLFKLSRWVTE